VVSALLIELNQTLGDVAQQVGITPLLEATERNDVETVKWCLSQGCDPDGAQTERRRTALHLAAKYTISPDITRSLLSYNATADAVAKHGITPLMRLAIKYSPQRDCPNTFPTAASDVLAKATFLLDAGADPNKTNNFGARALGLAIQQKKTQLAKLLLERGADPDVVFLPERYIRDRRQSALDVLREVGDTTMAGELAPLLQQ